MGSVKNPDLRVGIMSDIHIGFTAHADPRYYGLGQPGSQEKWWEYSLRWFRNRGVDAIVIPGDLTNAFDCAKCAFSVEHSRRELQRFAAIWKDVFGDTQTQLICIYGNHDQFIQAEETANGGDRDHWADAFGEPYAHVVQKTVKGYAFVGAHWGYEAEAGPVLARTAAQAQGHPVFYLQHSTIKNTTVGSDSALRHEVSDQGLNNVRDWENVVAFTGHTHCPLTDERAIWQSAAPGAPKCTSVACSTMNYGDPEEGPAQGENLATKHALYMTVTGNTVHMERISFWTQEMRALVNGAGREPNFAACTSSAGKAWHFTVGGEKPYDLQTRTAAATAPEFPDNATAGIRRGDRFALVSFPAALPLDAEDDLLCAYWVEAVDENAAVVSTGKVCTEYHIDHTADHFAPFYQVLVLGLRPDTKYTFRVYAVDCFGKKSQRPLTTTAQTMKENGTTQLK